MSSYPQTYTKPAAKKPAKLSTLRAQLAQVLSHPKLAPIHTLEALDRRLWAMGYRATCGRCGGSGSYSYNPIDGTRCYGCNGRGAKVERVTADLLKRATADAAAGKVEKLARKVCDEREAKATAPQAFASIEAAYDCELVNVGKDKNGDAYESPVFARLVTEARSVMTYAKDLRDKGRRLDLVMRTPSMLRKLKACQAVYAEMRDSGALAADAEVFVNIEDPMTMKAHLVAAKATAKAAIKAKLADGTYDLTTAA